MTFELDHVFVLVDPSAAWATSLQSLGLVVEDGVRHSGQGTRNRRVIFDENYLELLWIEDLDEAKRNPLRLDQRSTGPIESANPIGVALRGLPAQFAGDFWAYRPPYAPEAEIWIHNDNLTRPEQPFVFGFEASARRRRDRFSSEVRTHHPPRTAIRQLALRAAHIPRVLASVPSIVATTSRAPHVCVDLDSSAEEPPWNITNCLSVRG